MEPITILLEKRIVLAATGSIAVYKAVDLASKLTQAGALVDVIMTDAAQRFVSPITFQAVTGRAVYTDLWQTDTGGGLPTHIAHVGLSESADLLAVIPATADSLARLAHGHADDLLTITALAGRMPLLLAPAMDGGMYEHPATQANVQTLRERGATIIEPDEGRFASGHMGRGRLPDTPTLLGHIRRTLGQGGVLAGKHVLVTAGPTREAFDPVRYITNHSSGKQGYAVAQAALDAGARVTLISSVDLPPPIGVQLVRIDSTEDLLEAVIERLDEADALVMAAAVADFRPASRAEQKIKKGDNHDPMMIELARNPDVLASVKVARHPNDGKVIVGFAAESENLPENAQGKLERKGLDIIIGNDITASDAGFKADTNRVVILSKDREPEELDLRSKARIAERIIERVAALFTGNG